MKFCATEFEVNVNDLLLMG